MSTALRMMAVGLAIPLPAMSGAEPWTASKTAIPSPMFALGARPRPPTRPAVRSDTMSPNRFSMTITSNECGLSTSFIAAASMIAIVESDIRERLGNASAGAQEETVAEFEDVRFVNARDALATLAAGRFECESGDPLGGQLGDHAQAFDDAGHDFVLQAAVESLGVFANDDEVDVFVARRHAGHRSGGAIVGVKMQLLTQLDVDAAEAGAAWSGRRAFERGVRVFDRGERFGRQRAAQCIERRLAGEVGLPNDV